MSSVSLVPDLSPGRFEVSSVAQLLEARARAQPDRPFLIWAPFEGAARTWRYGEFRDRVARVAGAMAARGLKAGDRLVLAGENSPGLLLAFFACAWLGVVPALAHPKSSGEELAARAAQVGAVAALGDAPSAELFSRHAPALAWFGPLENLADLPGVAMPCLPAQPSQALALLFTSGTTAAPKAVRWTHANGLWAAAQGVGHLGLRGDDVCLVCVPVFHAVGLAWSVLPALHAGACIVLQPRFSASRYWGTALAHRATVGGHVQFTSRALFQREVPPGHGFRVWGNSTYLPAYAQHFAVDLVGWWGMTEVVSPGIVGRGGTGQCPGSIGWAAPGYRTDLVDDEGRPVGTGEVGHLRLVGERGVSLFATYEGDAQATQDAFDAQGRFITGDRMRLNEDGSLTFVDRAKDVIKVGGENVSPAEVEQAIRRVEGVAEVAVVAQPDSAYGEVCVAFVVPAARDEPPARRQDLVQRVLAACRHDLAPFRVPRAVHVLDALPRAGLDKVAKGELRRLAIRLAEEAPR